MPHDYHVHTSFSMDSQMPMEDACGEAIRRGVPQICFTEHVDYIPDDDGVGFFDPDGYFAELNRCRDLFGDQLVVRAGVEIGEMHRFSSKAQELTASYPFDFIIGSLHWVGTDLVMQPKYFEGRTRDDAYNAYFTELLALARHGGFDVAAHLDVPKRYDQEALGEFDSTRYAEQIRAVLRACVENGIGIEINTGSMRRTGGDPSPSPIVLEWYRELGGEILTFGSDGHRLAHMAYAFDRAREWALDAGFTRLAAFERRQPSFVTIA
ncbi:MAG: histidinol-phosphatase HisJ family protein [Nitrolancea sp.]